MALLSTARRTFAAQLRTQWRALAWLTVAALAAGLVLPGVLALLIPQRQSSTLAASFLLNLLGLGVVLLRLPQKPVPAWAHLTAWLHIVVIGGGGFLGLGLAGGSGVGGRMFVLLWGLLSAQAAALLAFHAVLTPGRNGGGLWARQVTLLTLCALVTAVFWSKAPIELLMGQGHGVLAGQVTQAVVSLSPPLAVASVWFRESTEPRFDIVRGPLTYNVWVGSTGGVAYPDIVPHFEPGVGFVPGLILRLLSIALPVLFIFDLVQFAGAVRKH